jgi:hypothetical protein
MKNLPTKGEAGENPESESNDSKSPSNGSSDSGPYFTGPINEVNLTSQSPQKTSSTLPSTLPSKYQYQLGEKGTKNICSLKFEFETSNRTALYYLH